MGCFDVSQRFSLGCFEVDLQRDFVDSGENKRTREENKRGEKRRERRRRGEKRKEIRGEQRREEKERGFVSSGAALLERLYSGSRVKQEKEWIELEWRMEWNGE